MKSDMEVSAGEEMVSKWKLGKTSATPICCGQMITSGSF